MENETVSNDAPKLEKLEYRRIFFRKIKVSLDVRVFIYVHRNNR